MTESKAPPFIVLALPRSRTAWLAHYLNYGGKKVGHDIAIMSDSTEAFLKSYSFGMAGTVETGAMLGWRLLKHHLPDLKTMIVFRPVEEVMTSFSRFGIAGPELKTEMISRKCMLDAIAKEPGVESFTFEDLHEPDVRAHIFETLLGLAFDPEWDDRFALTNIQVDFFARLMQLNSRAPQLAKLKADILAESKTLGVTESCQTFN